MSEHQRERSRERKGDRDAVQRQGAGGLGQRVLCRKGRPTGEERGRKRAG